VVAAALARARIGLATTALAVPAAIAEPIDMRSPDARDAAIHAPAADLRSPDARNVADRTEIASGTSSLAGMPSSSQDLRDPDGKEAPAPLPGPPASPPHPQVIGATQAAAHTDSDGAPWAMFAVGPRRSRRLAVAASQLSGSEAAEPHQHRRSAAASLAHPTVAESGESACRRIDVPRRVSN
jgi:hypothetical protein